MCKIGEIILIKNYKDCEGDPVSKHPFIIIEDNNGEIQGMQFDFASTVVCSFRDDEHRERKLKHDGNMEILSEQGVKKDGYIKADQIHYFDKNKIEFRVVGMATDDLVDDLFMLIGNLNDQEKLKVNLNNLQC